MTMIDVRTDARKAQDAAQEKNMATTVTLDPRSVARIEKALQSQIPLRKTKYGYAYTFTLPSEKGWSYPEKEIHNLATRYGASKVQKGYRFVAEDKTALYKTVLCFFYDLPAPTRA